MYVIIFLSVYYLTVVSSTLIESKVVHGERVSISHYSYSAFLFISTGDENHVCGSSIVNQRILLTAAHCIDDCIKHSCANSYGSTGHHDRTKGNQVGLSGFLIHNEYNENSVIHDIGLAFLKSSLKLGDFVKRVVLVKNPHYGTHASVAGWGLVDEREKRQTVYLHFTDLQLWTFNDCRKVIRSLKSSTFCAGQMKAQSFAAEGDSGSALVLRRFIQIGIVSYKIPDISPGIAIFTNTSYYYNWIKAHSKLLYCNKINKVK